MTPSQATQTQVIILLGPPGAGKGSQASLIKEKIDLAHISTGDLLRKNIKRETPLGLKAKSYMEAGQLVPDDLIFGMLFDRVEREDCKKGYILDGFPRNIDQAETFQKRLSNQSKIIAINLSIPDSAIVERITKRQICKTCQTPYHLLYALPKTAGKCDRCKGDLYQRSDDTSQVVEKRLSIYHEKTAPLIDYYSEKGALHTVNANTAKDKILSQILEILYI